MLVDLSLVSGVGKPGAYGMVMLAENLRPKQNDAAFRAATEPQLLNLLDSVNSTLPDDEKLQVLVVVQEPWTIENGLLTPTMKVNRARIEAVAQPEVDSWYAAKGARVIWATTRYGSSGSKRHEIEQRIL